MGGSRGFVLSVNEKYIVDGVWEKFHIPDVLFILVTRRTVALPPLVESLMPFLTE